MPNSSGSPIHSRCCIDFKLPFSPGIAKLLVLQNYNMKRSAIMRAGVLVVLALQVQAAPPPAAAKATNQPPVEIVLVESADITPEKIASWKKEGFKGVAIVLDESSTAAICQRVAKTVAARSLDLYYWVEVARNPALAQAHPRWMASLGMHQDWQERFPSVVPPQDDEVAKTYPWVSIGYQEAFDAQLARVNDLLTRVPSNFRGLLLNDLQGGPSSCGCGNLQCRWAIDYHATPTGTKIEGDDAAAKFVSAVRRQAKGKAVIPVWTTECEDEDMPAKKTTNTFTTGYCGTVTCAHGLCPKDFTRQWSALAASGSDPIALLALHREFNRARKEYGESPAWIARSVAYLDNVLPRFGGTAYRHQKLWLVVQGATPEEEMGARRAAAQTGASTVIVARAKIDQSFEPRIIPVK